jgi:hypothetical protein
MTTLRFVLTAALAGAAVAFTTPLASAQCPVAKITEAASNDLDEFGWRSALDGDLLAVSELGFGFSGSVHLFDVSGLLPYGRWAELDVVTGDDPAFGKQLGESLALSGDTLVAGAPQDDDFGVLSGAAYVFERDDQGTPGDPSDDAWVQTAKLYPNAASVPSRVGDDVDLEGDTLVVGSNGSAWIYHRDDQGTPSPLDDSWVEVQRLDPDGLSTFSTFGNAVAVTSDQQLVVVGDFWDTTGPAQGAATVFARDDVGVPGDGTDDVWVELGKLQAPAPSGGYFDDAGRTVAVSDDLVVLGSPGSGFVSEGVVHTFDRDDQGTATGLDDTFTYGQELSSTSGSFGGFGTDMAADGDRLVVGHLNYQQPLSKGLELVVFERAGGLWSPTTSLSAPDPQWLDGVGGGVGLDGDLLISGASGAEYVDDWSPADGAAYAWDLGRDPTWTSDPFNISGPSPIVAGWGTLEPLSEFGVRSYDLFFQVDTWFVVGLSRIDLPFKGGVLVPSPDIILGPVPTDSFGSVTLTGIWPNGVPIGTEVVIQSWVTGHLAVNPFEDSQGLVATTP